MKTIGINGKKTPARVAALFVALGLVLGLAAGSALAAGSKGYVRPAKPVELSGEVRSARAYQGDVLLVLVEFPATIRLTGATRFYSEEEHTTVTKDTAESLLPGKAVKIVKRLGGRGEYIAESVTVLNYEKSLIIRKLQPERLSPVAIPKKDAKIENPGSR